MDIRKDRIELYIKRTQRGESIKWTELYDSIEDLIADMINTSNRIRGYEYINSYKRKVRMGTALSGKEITQIKRMARFIFADINKL